MAPPLTCAVPCCFATPDPRSPFCSWHYALERAAALLLFLGAMAALAIGVMSVAEALAK